MPTYQCRIRTTSGEQQRMMMEAPSLQVVMERLHRDGFFILRVEKMGDAPGIKGRLKALRRARLDELVAFSREFAVMVRAGIPILEAIQGLLEHLKPGLLRGALEQVQKDVEDGRSLSEATRKHPQVFPALYVNLILAAEVGGHLDEVLRRAADYLSNSLALQRRVKSSMMYPVVILVATMFTLSYMVTFIMPRFSEMFRQMNLTLPFTTRILVGLGDLGDRHKALVLLSPLLMIGGAWGAWQIPPIRERLAYRIAHLPLIGDLTHKVVLTRALSAFQTLIAAGVPLGRALEIAANTAGDARMTRAFLTVRAEVEGGQALAASMKETRLFPTLVIQLMAAGEKTGQVSEMLEEIIAFYDDEVQQKLKGLTSILEPAMILFLGITIGVFAMSVISPIYSLMGQMGK